jgi:hypothetical protein
MPAFPVPIADLLLHPPLGLLSRELIPGVFSGSGDLTRNTGQLPPWDNVNAYGLTWSLVSIASSVGYIIGQPTIYEQRIIQVSTVHRGFDGHDLISEWHEFTVEGAYWLWENAGPQLVHYEIPINVALNLYWLVVHP